MTFNFKKAKDAPCFIVPSTFNKDSLTENEKSEVVQDLLANSHLVGTNFLKYVNEEQSQKLTLHINANRARILSYFHITADYTDVSDNTFTVSTEFKFGSPSFLRAKSVFFHIHARGRFEVTLSDKDALIEYILFELAKCKHLTSCDFTFYVNRKEQPFLAQRQEAVLKNILANNREYQRKFQFDAQMFWGVTFGLVGLMTIGFPDIILLKWLTCSAIFLFTGVGGFVAHLRDNPKYWVVAFGLMGLMSIGLPGMGLLKGLACSGFLFFGGVSFGSLVSYLRKNALYAAGANALQDLKEDKVPDNDDLKEAMALGFKSREWSPYLNSFLHLKSYQRDNYRAYAAGLYAGTQRLQEESSTIERKLSL